MIEKRKTDVGKHEKRRERYCRTAALSDATITTGALQNETPRVQLPGATGRGPVSVCERSPLPPRNHRGNTRGPEQHEYEQCVIVCVYVCVGTRLLSCYLSVCYDPCNPRIFYPAGCLSSILLPLFIRSELHSNIFDIFQ